MHTAPASLARNAAAMRLLLLQLAQVLPQLNWFHCLQLRYCKLPPLQIVKSFFVFVFVFRVRWRGGSVCGSGTTNSTSLQQCQKCVARKKSTVVPQSAWIMQLNGVIRLLCEV